MPTWKTGESSRGWKEGLLIRETLLRGTSVAPLTAELDQDGFTSHFLFSFCGKRGDVYEKLGEDGEREVGSQEEQRCVGMDEEGAKGIGELEAGMARPEGLGLWLAQCPLPEMPKDAWVSFVLASPMWPLHLVCA